MPEQTEIEVKPHPLQNSWCIWEHEVSKNSSEWGSSMTNLGEFNTVEGFWRYYNNIPKPSQIFFDGKSKKKVGDRQIESFSIFKKGIRPAWEDDANAAGGEWSCRDRLQPAILDLMWENLLLGLIGETIDWADEICGARVVDKSRGKDPNYRFELWVRSQESTVIGRLKERLLTCIGDSNPPIKSIPEFTFKGH